MSKAVATRDQAPMRDARRSSVLFRGGALAVYSWGEGPTVLLVHGWSGRASQLARYAAPLVARGYRAVAVDGPGHGRSDGWFTNLPQMADALMAVQAQEGPFAGVLAHSVKGRPS
jgi:pimeloyl-ACP methyl ester carboxylesterase